MDTIQNNNVSINFYISYAVNKSVYKLHFQIMKLLLTYNTSEALSQLA